eukprot:3140848-Amphidinium_carterae.1
MASSELQFIWDDRRVAAGTQDILVQAGFADVALFAAYADTRDELRRQLSQDYGMDPAEAGITPDVRRDRRLQLARL